MSDLIKLLEQFNRKERHFLALRLMGEEKFQLPDEFRKDLKQNIDGDIPCSAVAFIDFHLDWVLAALEAHKRGDTEGTFATKLKGTNLDIDCLIAFAKDEDFYLIFLEAKAYPESGSGWTNDQMGKKAKRLKSIFGEKGKNYSGVHPYFCLLSPKKPGTSFETGCWPCWMKKSNNEPHHLKWRLTYPRLKATRCNADGSKSESGEHFRIYCVN